MTNGVLKFHPGIEETPTMPAMEFQRSAGAIRELAQRYRSKLQEILGVNEDVRMEAAACLMMSLRESFSLSLEEAMDCLTGAEPGFGVDAIHIEYDGVSVLRLHAFQCHY